MKGSSQARTNLVEAIHMQDHRNLQVWQKGMDTTVAVYRGTAHFSKSELFGLTGQLRRAMVSVVANVAEGANRGSDRDFARFISIAAGSSSEALSHLELARRLGYLSPDEAVILIEQVEEVQRMLGGLRSSLLSSTS